MKKYQLPVEPDTRGLPWVFGPTSPQFSIRSGVDLVGLIRSMALSFSLSTMADHIRFKLEDILDELASAKGTLIWDKLDAANWARYMMNITNATRKDSMDKQTINNLVETNAYLTKRIVELECTTSNIEPKMTQPQGPPPNKNPIPTPTQLTWARVAANTHCKTPTQPAQPACKTPQPTHQGKTANPQCLIIQVNPPIPAMERPNGIDVRNQINSMLDKKQIPQYF